MPEIKGNLGLNNSLNLLRTPLQRSEGKFEILALRNGFGGAIIAG